jgi:CxxC motif-containing protein
MKKELTCIVCPRGCLMTAEVNADGSVSVSGNFCPRGEKYAQSELISPTRVVTGTVRVVNRADTMVSVKTDAPIPKDKIFELMKLVHGVSVAAPVRSGDVIIADAFGARVVATGEVL